MEEVAFKLAQEKKVRKWTTNEIVILIESWKRNYKVKRQVSDKSNKSFYLAICKDLCQHGYKRSLKEIVVKTQWLLRSYRKEKKYVLKKGCMGNFPFFCNMIDIEKLESQTESINKLKKGCMGDFQYFCNTTDIEKLESQTESINTKSGVDCSLSSDESDEEIIAEENDPEAAQVTKDNLPSDGCNSDSASQSCFVDNHSEEPDEAVAEGTSILVNNSHLPNSDLPATTEDILLGFYKEFQKTNHQFKRNDAILLGLFKDQNEIFKTQACLMKKLMKQDI